MDNFQKYYSVLKGIHIMTVVSLISAFNDLSCEARVPLLIRSLILPTVRRPPLAFLGHHAMILISGAILEENRVKLRDK